VPLDAPPEPVGGAEIEEPAAAARPPKARAAQNDDPYTEVQVPMPEAAPQATDAPSLGGSGLANTGLELSLLLAAGLSTLGAGMLVLGLVRRPR